MFDGFDEGRQYIPGWHFYIIPDNFANPFFTEHPALRVLGLPDTIGSDDDDLARLNFTIQRINQSLQEKHHDPGMSSCRNLISV